MAPLNCCCGHDHTDGAENETQGANTSAPIRPSVLDSRSEVVIREDVIETPSDPRPNAFFDASNGMLRVYHGPKWGNPMGSLPANYPPRCNIGSHDSHAQFLSNRLLNRGSATSYNDNCNRGHGNHPHCENGCSGHYGFSVENGNAKFSGYHNSGTGNRNGNSSGNGYNGGNFHGGAGFTNGGGPNNGGFITSEGFGNGGFNNGGGFSNGGFGNGGGFVTERNDGKFNNSVFNGGYATGNQGQGYYGGGGQAPGMGNGMNRNYGDWSNGMSGNSNGWGNKNYGNGGNNGGQRRDVSGGYRVWGGSESPYLRPGNIPGPPTPGPDRRGGW